MLAGRVRLGLMNMRAERNLHKLLFTAPRDGAWRLASSNSVRQSLSRLATRIHQPNLLKGKRTYCTANEGAGGSAAEHTAESLQEAFFSFQEAQLGTNFMGVRIPKFCLALVVFYGLGFFKDATSLTLAKRISSQQELTPEQKTQLLSMAGDKEDTVLSNLGLALGLRDPILFLTLPLLASLFAASIGVMWGRFRVRRAFDKFLFTVKDRGVPRDVIQEARSRVIAKGMQSTAIGSLALSMTYISYYAIVARFWFRDYISQMDKIKWQASKESDLKLPSDANLLLYLSLTMIYFICIQFVALKHTPYIIFPSVFSSFPLFPALSTSPAFQRVQEKAESRMKSAKGIREPEAKEVDEFGDWKQEGAEGEGHLHEESTPPTRKRHTPEENVFGTKSNMPRVRAIISSKGRSKEKEESSAAEEMEKENKWGDIVLDDLEGSSEDRRA